MMLSMIHCVHYVQRGISPHHAAQQKYFCYLENENIHLKTQHQYYYQVQGKMAVCSKKWCNFVVYTNSGTSVERIDFNEIFWKDMLVKLNSFYVSSVLPKLVNKLAQ